MVVYYCELYCPVCLTKMTVGFKKCPDCGNTALAQLALFPLRRMKAINED
jgi:hypothetical protein